MRAIPTMVLLRLIVFSNMLDFVLALKIKTKLVTLLVDLPQVDLMNFRVEYVRPQSGRASDEVARGRLVSLEGFSFAFRAKK